MRYLLTIYALFILAYDFYSTGSQLWNVLYFTIQYVFAGSVAVYYVFNGRPSRMIFLTVAGFFYMLAVFELSMLRYDQSEYFLQITKPESLLSCGITFILITILLIIARKIIK